MNIENSSQSHAEKPKLFYGYIIVIISFLILFASHAIHLSFGIFFVPMLTEFGWTRAGTSGAFFLSWIVIGLLSIAMGGLNDRFGPRIVVTVCGFLLGIGSFLMSQITTVWQFYIVYGLIIGTGMCYFVPITSTVARWFIRRRSTMTGIIVTGVGLGLFIGPRIAAQLIEAYDWRTSYIIMGGIALVIIVACAQFLRRDPAHSGQTAYVSNDTSEEGPMHGAEEISPKEAVLTRQFWLVFIMFFSFGFCTFASQIHIAPHATDLGIPLTRASNILLIMGLVSMIARTIMGYMADRIGNKWAFAIGFALVLAGIITLMPAQEMWQFLIFAGIFGLGHGDCDTQLSPIVATLFGLTSHGLIFGLVNVGFTLGAAVGPLVAGYIFDVTNSYQVAFLVSAVLAGLGLISSLLLKPVANKQAQ